MPAHKESLDSVILSLGYSDERALFDDLYTKQGFSLEEIGSLLGMNYTSVRKRLLALGVKLRSRGGPNHTRKD